MFGAVGAFPHALCRRKTLARLPWAWTLTCSTSFLSTSPTVENLRELHHPRAHYTSFSFDCIWQMGSKLPRKGLSPHTSLPREFLKDLLCTEFWNHWNEPLLYTSTIFFPDLSVHEYVFFFKFCLIWNEKLFPCLQILCRMGKQLMVRAPLRMRVCKIMLLWLYSFCSA